MTLSAIEDAELVGLCLRGDRQAYQSLVERYQALVCAVAFSGCGDLHQSEDIAQEAFVEAWKHLPELKDPGRVRPWLCGIARNVVASTLRKSGRRPAVALPDDADQIVGRRPGPEDIAISAEEQAILWQHLSRLPETYRLPLVLYYRDEESMAAVADTLELSEETARQRLSRGRAMLAERIDQAIRQGLRRGRPAKAFALAVIAALPATAATAHAAAIGAAAAAKGGLSAKAAASAFAATSFLGPFAGLAGGYLGYRAGLQQAIAPEERRLMRRFFYGTALFALLFTVAILFATMRAHGQSNVRAGVFVGLALCYVLGLLVTSLSYWRRIQRLRTRLLAERPELAARANAGVARWNYEYRSRWCLLGLPLIHINWGSSADARPLVARGWVAIGAKAYGVLFACGAVAVGGVSVGGISVGILTWGGFALGMIVWGGFAAGAWAVGGLAIGWQAFGGCAIGWSAAVGGFAVAREYAIGGYAIRWSDLFGGVDGARSVLAGGAGAVAAAANNDAALKFTNSAPFFRIARAVTAYANWAWLLVVVMVLPVILRARRPQNPAHLPAGESDDRGQPD